MTDRYIPEHRRTNFKAKNAFKPDELRRRREEQQVEIRKAKREEALAKKRNINNRLGESLGAALDSDEEGIAIEGQVRLERHSCVLFHFRPPCLAEIGHCLLTLSYAAHPC